jgi:hypothetical protein
MQSRISSGLLAGKWRVRYLRVFAGSGDRASRIAGNNVVALGAVKQAMPQLRAADSCGGCAMQELRRDFFIKPA